MEEIRSTTCTTTPDPAAGERAAVEALTGLARTARELGADGFARADVGELIAGVLVQVAANLGGTVEALLGDRPGSRFAPRVAELMTAHTSGPDIIRHRTAPVLLHVDVTELFDGVGITQRFLFSWHEVKRELERCTDAQHYDVLCEVVMRVEELYRSDRHRYVTAYEHAATIAARGEGIAESVDVEVIPTGPGVPGHTAAWDDLAAALHVAAATACEDVISEILTGESYQARAWRDVTGSPEPRRVVVA